MDATSFMTENIYASTARRRGCVVIAIYAVLSVCVKGVCTVSSFSERGARLCAFVFAGRLLFED